jgi:hypothetical protein
VHALCIAQQFLAGKGGGWLPDEPGLWIWNVIPHHSTAVTVVDAVNVCYLASSTSGHIEAFSAGNPAC